MPNLVVKRLEFRRLPSATAWAGLALLASTLGCAGAPAEGAPEGEAAAEGESSRPELPFELVEGEPMYTVLPVDAIPAIDAPTFVDVQTASAFMTDDEPVLGVVGADGTAKCYSAWHLEEHEIVNDQLDGVAIAATW